MMDTGVNCLKINLRFKNLTRGTIVSSRTSSGPICVGNIAFWDSEIEEIQARAFSQVETTYNFNINNVTITKVSEHAFSNMDIGGNMDIEKSNLTQVSGNAFKNIRIVGEWVYKLKNRNRKVFKRGRLTIKDSEVHHLSEMALSDIVVGSSIKIENTTIEMVASRAFNNITVEGKGGKYLKRNGLKISKTRMAQVSTNAFNDVTIGSIMENQTVPSYVTVSIEHSQFSHLKKSAFTGIKRGEVSSANNGAFICGWATFIDVEINSFGDGALQLDQSWKTENIITGKLNLTQECNCGMSKIVDINDKSAIPFLFALQCGVYPESPSIWKVYADKWTNCVRFI